MVLVIEGRRGVICISRASIGEIRFELEGLVDVG
jgi:hypothetical protein